MSTSAFPYGNIALSTGAGFRILTGNINGVSTFSSSLGSINAAIALNSTGVFRSSNVSTGILEDNGIWLEGTGDSTGIFVERTITSGSLDFDSIGSGRAAAGGANLSVTQTGVGTKQCILTLNFYDVASGGSPIATSGTISLFAEIV